MTAWTSDELETMGSTDELRVASLRADGTLRQPRIVWVVCHAGEVYLRSVNGPTAAWYRGTQTLRMGRIWVGGIEKDVSFVAADADIDDALNAAYRRKYANYDGSIIDAMNRPEARLATLKLVPR